MSFKEGIFQGLTVLGVFAGFAYIIFARMHKNNPSAIQKLKNLFTNKKEEVKDKFEGVRQTYDEKRSFI